MFNAQQQKAFADLIQSWMIASLLSHIYLPAFMLVIVTFVGVMSTLVVIPTLPFFRFHEEDTM